MTANDNKEVRPRKLTREQVLVAAIRLNCETFADVCADLKVNHITLRTALKREGVYVYRGNPPPSEAVADAAEEAPAAGAWDVALCNTFRLAPTGATA
jgi:hypothetical protein